MKNEKEYQPFGKEWEVYLMKRVKKADLIKMYKGVCIELKQVKSVDLADVGGALPNYSDDVNTESALNMGRTLDIGKQ